MKKRKRTPFRDYTAESKLFIRRVIVAFSGILVLTGILVFNLYHLQVARHDDYQTRSNDNRIKLVPIPPSRGIIYDRNGVPLALNRTIYQLEIVPEKVANIQETLESLREVVDLTDDDIAAFEKSENALVVLVLFRLKRHLTKCKWHVLPLINIAIPD